MSTRHTQAADTWMKRASCATTRPDLPWLHDSHAVSDDDARTMARVCGHCPVFTKCVRHAAETNVTGGYWAGLDRDIYPELPLRRSA